MAPIRQSNDRAPTKDQTPVVAMPEYTIGSAAYRLFVASLAAALGVFWGPMDRAAAQNAPRVRDHIILPPQYGATVASPVIFAQASYVAAMGDFMESAANARVTHAVAAEHETRNALLWTEIYFKRRQLNRAFRKEENPGFLEKEERRQAQFAIALSRRPRWCWLATPPTS